MKKCTYILDRFQDESRFFVYAWKDTGTVFCVRSAYDAAKGMNEELTDKLNELAERMSEITTFEVVRDSIIRILNGQGYTVTSEERS